VKYSGVDKSSIGLSAWIYGTARPHIPALGRCMFLVVIVKLLLLLLLSGGVVSVYVLCVIRAGCLSCRTVQSWHCVICHWRFQSV